MYKVTRMTTLPNLRSFLTVGEAAEILGVNPITLRRWDAHGKLKAFRHPISCFRLYRREHLIELLTALNEQRG